MARRRGPNEPSTYQGRPEIPPELARRFALICAVLGERITISEAARELGISRVSMQTLVHRVEAAMVAALQPRKTGPRPVSTAQRSMEEEVARLRKANEKLTRQLQAADDMMGAAGKIIRSLRGLPPSSARASSSRTKRMPKTSSDEDPEPATTSSTILTRALARLTTTSGEATKMSRLLGIDSKTLRRWIGRLAAGQPLIRRRGGVMQPGPPADEQCVRDLVRDLHGLAGAESLARSVHGVSRRRAAMLKREVLTEMEKKRRAECATVQVSVPGVIRGFDAMHETTGFALIASDACVPFRTTVKHVAAYDAEHVAEALDADFRTHGPPLVLRQDRARCHTAGPVASVLHAHGVLLLQGPSYYAPYYGQLERQNAEHRVWCAWGERTQADLDRMKIAVNERWRRPTLGWMTAAQRWDSRPKLDEDRDALRADVEHRAERLRARNVSPDLAMRLAIEQALTQRGYLHITSGRQPAMRTEGH